MQSSTEEQLSLFAEGSPASLSVLPGSKMAQQMTEASGRKCLESYGKFSPLGSLVKMFLASSVWNSTKCYLTWTVQVTPAKHLIFRLAQSTLTTYAIESGLLPTPTAQPYGNNQGGGSGRVGPVRHSLSSLAKMHPTPTNSMRTIGDLEQARYAGNDPSRPKYSEANMYPTPTKTDAIKGGKVSPRPGAMGLSETLGGQLNPQWVEWLQGYPIGWTDLKDSETP